MLQNITEMLQNNSSNLIAPLLALTLGLLSALASSCCTLPVIGMLAAYSGTQESKTKKDSIISSVCFLFGTIIALIIFGLIAGFVGQKAQSFLGKYWKIFAGFVAITIGLIALKLLPIPKISNKRGNFFSNNKSILGPSFSGLILGGGVAASSLPCNPGIFIVLGASILMGKIAWGILLMTMFSIGFSIPLAAVMFGISLGRFSFKAEKMENIVRSFAGILLIVGGFYLLINY